ncbi:MAG TPA: HlyD family secretion protein [Opitutaceae bacterium]|nr:HlyD family secretion protein [Opitutaceae bacterium]
MDEKPQTQTSPAHDEWMAQKQGETREPKDGSQKGSSQNEGKAPEAKSKTPWYKHPAKVGIVILVVIALTIGVTIFWIHARQFEKTDDAFIDTPTQQVSPQVEGRIQRVLVQDNQEVAAGDVLVELDPANYQVLVDQAEAALAQAETQVLQAEAQRSVYSSQLAQSRAALDVAEANAANANSQRDRTISLRDRNIGAVSQEQVDSAIAAQKSATAQTEAAQRAVSAAEAQLSYSQSLISAAQAGVRGAQARLEQAKLNLSYTKVTADISGTVARKEIQVGNFVQPSTALMAIVPKSVYVTANFKENQLARMKPGQPVEIHVDAYPDLELRGRVDSFQSGTGQAFSGLPAENATGNWVKVVQRVPVKIVLDQVPQSPSQRLGPGLSVEVKVRVKED